MCGDEIMKCVPSKIDNLWIHITESACHFSLPEYIESSVKGKPITNISLQIIEYKWLDVSIFILIYEIALYILGVSMSLSKHNFWYPSMGWCEDCKFENHDDELFTLNVIGKLGEIPNFDYPTDFPDPLNPGGHICTYDLYYTMLGK